MIIRNRQANNNIKPTKIKLLILSWAIFIITSSCSSRPFGYILSPMETSVASGWTSTPTAIPTKTPQPTPTRKPTNTPRPTSTPRPTATEVPTQSLPLDTTVYIINQLSVGLSISCSGPYSLDFYVPGLETKIINIPSGAYSCIISAPGYDLLFKSNYWSAGEWEWTFSNQ